MSKKGTSQLRELTVEEGHVLYPQKDKLNKVIKEVNEETDRGAALFTASLLDEALGNILSNYFTEGAITKKLFKYPDPLSSFSARQNMCLALGLISKVEFDECNIIRSIRNKFAHSSAYSIDFNVDIIAKLCTSLSLYSRFKKKHEGKIDYNRHVFMISITTLLFRWTERSEDVKSIKRTLLDDNAVKNLK